jgi:hypothetical protein
MPLPTAPERISAFAQTAARRGADQLTRVEAACYSAGKIEIQRILGREDLTQADKQAILAGKAKKFYGVA